MQVQEARKSNNLRSGLHLAKPTNRDFSSLAHLCHPFTQRANGYFSTNDDDSRDGEPRTVVELHQQNERCGDHEFICHRVKKSAKAAFDVPSPRQISVKPIGNTGDDENKTRDRPSPRIRQIENHNNDWQQRDTQKR